MKKTIHFLSRQDIRAPRKEKQASWKGNLTQRRQGFKAKVFLKKNKEFDFCILRSFASLRLKHLALKSSFPVVLVSFALFLFLTLTFVQAQNTTNHASTSVASLGLARSLGFDLFHGRPRHGSCTGSRCLRETFN